jgi:hypothetical protein
MHITKRSRFSVPWSIQPPPSLTEVDCGVFIEYKIEMDRPVTNCQCLPPKR